MSKAALFVGINNFKNFLSYRLRGCVADTALMRSLYVDVHGFDPVMCVTLIDAQATKNAVINELQSLISRANSGELSHIVFSLSTHGTQIRDRNGDETDGRDEAFVMHDLAMGATTWAPGTIITDDEFSALFKTLDPNVLLEVFFDTCHSGTGLRGSEFGEHRATPRFVSIPNDDLDDAIHIQPRRRLTRNTDMTGENVVLWAGCAEAQTSADAYFFPSGYNGAFTYHYCKSVRELVAVAPSRLDILTRVRGNMKTKFRQTPQLETNAYNRSAVVVVP